VAPATQGVTPQEVRIGELNKWKVVGLEVGGAVGGLEPSDHPRMDSQHIPWPAEDQPLPDRLVAGVLDNAQIDGGLEMTGAGGRVLKPGEIPNQEG
jgi:hypothetical protein